MFARRFFQGLFATLVATQTAAAEIPLSDAFAACEQAVLGASAAPLQHIGTLLFEDERITRFRIETPKGNVVANWGPPGQLNACILWGRHPDLEEDYANQWTDWVEWPEAAGAASEWFDQAIGVQASVDLTDRRQPGFVVARCNAMEHGVVLAAQPAVSGVIRQIQPKPEASPPERRVFFQFSVQRAMAGRCQAAVDRMAK